MRKKFWIIFIIIIVLTVAAIALGIVARLKTGPTASAPTESKTTTASPEALAQLETAPTIAPVVIQNFSFNPPVIKIKKGDSVIWTNRDNAAHTATLDDNTQSTPLIVAGQSAVLKFEKSGTFNYYCRPHPWMKGQIIVE